MFIIHDVSFAVFHFNQKVVVLIRLSTVLSRLQVPTEHFIGCPVRRLISVLQGLAE